jgi:hypothetical protein
MDFRHHSTESHQVHAAPDDAREWTVADLIDFEYYLDADERELREHPSARKALAERDRALYLDRIAPEVADEAPHTPSHRRVSLRRWLAARRNGEDPPMRGILPGAAFDSAQRLVTLMLAVIGFLAGVGIASALLSYDGTRPVSVSWYLFLLVIVQFLLVASVVSAWLLRRTRGRGSASASGLLMHVIRPLVTKAASLLQGQRIGHARAEIQDQALARQGLLKSQFALYGPVSYLPLIIPAQIFGVAFNVGVILTTVLLEWFTDLAFGWGSTLNVHPQTIFDITRLIALPWSWLLGEGIGYPSLEQVAGSRIILEHWATATPTIKPDPAHLRSWGSFLVMAVVTYGLLPRLVLWGGSVLAQHLILARLPFTHSRTQALYGRMLSPRLETTTGGARQGVEMPIPGTPETRKPRATVSDATAEPTPAASARPWRNGLVQRTKPEKTDVPTAPLSEVPAPKQAEPAAPPAAAPPVEHPPERPRAAAPTSSETSAHATPVHEHEQPPLRPEPSGVERSKPEAALPVEPESKATAEIPPETPPGVSVAEPAVRTAPTQVPTTEPLPSASDRAPEVSDETPPISGETPASDADETPVADLSAPVPRPATAPPKHPRKPEPEAEPEAPPVEIKRVAPDVAPPPAEAPEPTAGPPDEGPAPTPALIPAPAPASAPPSATSRAAGFAPDACLLLLHVDIDDILEEEDRPRLERMLLHHTGWRVAATATFGAGSAMTEQAIAVLEGGDWQAPPPRVVVIEDGSQPPITESLRFLRELRAAAGAHAQIMLALVGDPTEDDRLPPMRPFDYTDWQRKIDRMADPYLRLEMLAQPDEDGDD